MGNTSLKAAARGLSSPAWRTAGFDASSDAKACVGVALSLATISCYRKSFYNLHGDECLLVKAESVANG
jgi:hypothetical protein